LHVHGASKEARCGQSALVEQASVQAPTISEFASQAAGTTQAEVSVASQRASAFTQTLVGGVPTGMQPYPLGQSEPEAQVEVQYLGPWRQAKLHSPAAVQVFPISLVVQYFSAPTALHLSPLGQPPSTTHVRVQRLGPFFHIGRQSSDVEHSLSAAQRSSSTLLPLIPPPDPLEEELDELETVDEALEDAEDDAEEALTLDAPPMPPAPDPPAPPEPGPAPPVSSGKHWPA